MGADYKPGTVAVVEDAWGRPRRIIPVLDRLMAKVIRRPSGCWEFTGYINPAGYGQISDGDRQMRLAHRVAYRELVGPIPDGLTLDHLCRVRHCVNPEHLEPVTQKVNSLRANTPKTHCVNGHEFTTDNVYRKANGKRYCRTCSIARSRARRGTR